MDYESVVKEFFTEHAVGSIHVTARPASQHLDISQIGFQLTHEAYGKQFHIPPLLLGRQNAFLKVADWAHAAHIMNHGVYEITVTHLEEIGVRDGHNILPIEWHVTCEVNAPSMINHMEAIEKIIRGVRIEHFFLYDKKVLDEWIVLLREVADTYTKTSVDSCLRNFKL